MRIFELLHGMTVFEATLREDPRVVGEPQSFASLGGYGGKKEMPPQPPQIPPQTGQMVPDQQQMTDPNQLPQQGMQQPEPQMAPQQPEMAPDPSQQMAPDPNQMSGSQMGMHGLTPPSPATPQPTPTNLT